MQKIKKDSYLYKTYCEVPILATTGIKKEELIFRIGKHIRPEIVSRNMKSGGIQSFESGKTRYSTNIILHHVKSGRLRITENGNYIIML